MPKCGEGAVAWLKMWAGTPAVQNKNVLFPHTGLNISSQTEGTNAHRPFYCQERLAGPHLQPQNVFPWALPAFKPQKNIFILRTQLWQEIVPRRDVQAWLTALSNPEHSLFFLQEKVGSEGLDPLFSSTFRASTQFSVAWTKCQPCRRNGIPMGFVQALWSNSEGYHHEQEHTCKSHGQKNGLLCVCMRAVGSHW